MKHIPTFDEFINESYSMPKPIKGLKYEKTKAKDLKVGDELSDGIKETCEISKVVSISPFKLEIVETIIPRNHPEYKAPGTVFSHEIRPFDDVYKIIR